MANRPKSELREFLNAVKRTEKELLTLVMGSFLFSLLPAIARYKDVSFSAVVELLGGCMGAAGVLSAFFGSYVHPAEKYEVLDYRPIFPGLGVAVCISLSALCFYLFYSLSDYSNDLSLLFVAAGTFLFFYMLGRAVVVIERIEFQKAIWAGMTSEMRTRFYDRQAALEKLSNDLEKTVEQQRRRKGTSRRLRSRIGVGDGNGVVPVLRDGFCGRGKGSLETACLPAARSWRSGWMRENLGSLLVSKTTWFCRYLMARTPHPFSKVPVFEYIETVRGCLWLLMGKWI